MRIFRAVSECSKPHCKVVNQLAKVVIFVACLLGVDAVRNATSERHRCNVTTPEWVPEPYVMHKIISKEEMRKFEHVFVIGDVHGCFDELMSLLNKSGALSDSTLKIFAGDVIQKGPKSRQVLKFLRNSTSSLAVRGNQDENSLRKYLQASSLGYSLEGSDAWINELTPEEIEFIKDLPYTITLEELNAVVVHAGLVPGQKLECMDPEDLVNMRNVIHEANEFKAIHNHSEGNPWAALWSGPPHVYFGHDSLRMFQNYSFATGLDTGCVFGNRLTGLFISGEKKGTMVSQDAFATYATMPSSRSSKLSSNIFSVISFCLIVLVKLHFLILH